MYGLRKKYPVLADSVTPLDYRVRDWLPCQPLRALPSTVSWAGHLGTVKNQLQYGSCSAESGSGLVETEVYRTQKKRVDLSSLFLYEAERTIMNTLYEDSGAPLRVTELALMKYGVCPTNQDPFVPADFVRDLTPLLASARPYRIDSGYWAPSLNEVVNALARGYCVQIGIQVYPSFESDAVATTGNIPMPSASDLATGALGGHAVLVYGYDATQNTVFFRNSWGTGWGQQGNGTLPFEYFTPPLFLSGRVYTL